MLHEELGEFGDGDVTFVRSIRRLQRLESGRGLRRGQGGGLLRWDGADSLADLEGRERRAGVAWVRNEREVLVLV
jgi:hypothetical protein